LLKGRGLGVAMHKDGYFESREMKVKNSLAVE
jgi:hypothetical protein